MNDTTLSTQTKHLSDCNRRWLFVRLLTATILLCAAAMKTHQLATSPSLGEGLLHARWFNILVVEFELFFGVWLIFGMLPRLTWLATVGCFTVFALVSLYKAVSGESSCGCFGLIEIYPLYTALFDSCVVCLLLWTCFKFFRNNTGEEREYKIDPLAVACLLISWIALSGTSLGVMLTYTPATLMSSGDISGDSQAVLLEPKDWIGKSFPLLKYVQINENLEVGQWAVVLYEAECKRCNDKFKAWNREGVPGHEEEVRLAFLNVSGDKSPLFREIFSKNNWFWGTLNHSRRWYVETPSIIYLSNGIVADVLLKP